ncbi:MAG: carboxymethylenebutenolidase [Bacteroidetes bacterium GWE2_41_25]|nr:MAG: carboxymethylenebutenolidase [Bacteroidetes bacterium GWA2_40_15]OFX93940.1 MAG: carboxymethylenebutenolidase [Bacteroidetes bacterium GWE2_41_25]OFY00875.1 MAG: carboxymethylenebutenolidase [Bacteroidetes bacterium GWC2_40_22]HBH84830.1 carboxymethylenebutenolidase [Bacteroidales bacterium]HBQ82218.1 carboxymethylenebutenolidase [Bacteroidales bacterium]
MKKNISKLYDDYKQGRTSRRDFIRKLTLFAGSTAAAMSLLPVLEDNSLKAASSVQDDGDLITEFIKYPAEAGEMRGFLARPKKGKKFPAVMVIHENRGLQPHIQDVTRRMAKEGFLALSPDALSPLGGTPDNDPAKSGEMMRELNSEQTVKNFVAAVKYLDTHPLSNGKVGCTGFCWGGAMTNQVAVNSPDLDAAVPYYGRQPAAEDVPKIKAPVMAHYAGNDPGINAGIAAFEEELKKNKKEYQIFMYEGASHAFNNDSNPERYNEAAAKLAWGRTVGFFKEKLK